MVLTDILSLKDLLILILMNEKRNKETIYCYFFISLIVTYNKIYKYNLANNQNFINYKIIDFINFSSSFLQFALILSNPKYDNSEIRNIILELGTLE
jgi:hypothetical protein